MAKILVVEDDNDINMMICSALSASGHECVGAYSGTEGLLRIEHDEYDLILLDLMLPGMDGKALLAQIKNKISTPIIVVSAIDSLENKVDLLTLGADDYITKPFQIEELRARVLVQLRKNTSPKIKMKHKGLIMDDDLHQATINGVELILTSQEYKILELLLQNKSKVYSKQEIYQYAWNDYYIGEDKTINVHISNIRQKIKKITNEEYIDTIWGVGFRLSKEV